MIYTVQYSHQGKYTHYSGSTRLSWFSARWNRSNHASVMNVQIFEKRSVIITDLTAHLRHNYTFRSLLNNEKVTESIVERQSQQAPPCTESRAICRHCERTRALTTRRALTALILSIHVPSSRLPGPHSSVSILSRSR